MKKEPTYPLPVQKVQVCAWRVKYYIELSAPLSAAAWQAMRDTWVGSRLEVTPLPNGEVLYQLALPEKKGSLLGSSASAGLYAILARPEAEALLRHVIETLRLHDVGAGG